MSAKQQAIKDIKALYPSVWEQKIFYEVFYDDVYGNITITIIDFESNAPVPQIEDFTRLIDYDDDGCEIEVTFHAEVYTYPKPWLGDKDSYDVYLIETHEKAIEERHREYEKELEENLKLMNQAFCKKYGKLPNPAMQKVHAIFAASTALEAALKEGVALAQQEQEATETPEKDDNA